MSPLTSAPVCSTLLFVGVFVFASSDPINVTAECGQKVTLTCRAPNNSSIVVKWSRADLRDEYVLLYRDGRFVPDDQHPSFKNRVDLQDSQMMDGDVSLILKNVTTADEGTYECHIIRTERDRLTLISSINLRVVAPPGSGGAVGLIVGLSVAAVLLVAAVGGFLIYKKFKHKQNSKPSAEL